MGKILDLIRHQASPPQHEHVLNPRYCEESDEEDRQVTLARGRYFVTDRMIESADRDLAHRIKSGHSIFGRT